MVEQQQKNNTVGATFSSIFRVVLTTGRLPRHTFGLRTAAQGLCTI